MGEGEGCRCCELTSVASSRAQILATVCVCAPLLGAVVLPIEQRPAKLACAALFHAVDGVLLSSLGFVGAGILYPAALITAGTATGLGALAMCAPPRLYMTLAAPLSAGLAVLALGNLFAAFAGSAGCVPRAHMACPSRAFVLRLTYAAHVASPESPPHCGTSEYTAEFWSHQVGG